MIEQKNTVDAQNTAFVNNKTTINTAEKKLIKFDDLSPGLKTLVVIGWIGVALSAIYLLIIIGYAVLVFTRF